jgi:glycosyltransferase involved in cell wall biosynthesis
VSSARGQSRPPDEIIVVNDGSDDETTHVLADLKDSGPLIVVENPVALGPAMSFNVGVSASSGTLLLALDADDALSPRFLELTEEAILRGADLAYGGIERFGSESGYEPPREFDADELGVENFIYVSTLVRRLYFDLSGGFKPDLDRLGLEDWEFWLAAVEGGAQGYAVEGCWMRYRRHPEGSRNSIRRFDALRVHLRMHRLHPGVVTRWHLARWVARSLDRNLRGRRKAHS